MQTPVSVILKEKGSKVFSAEIDETVMTAITRMNDARVGALLVKQGDKPVGMFTERDVTTKLVPSKMDPEATQLKDVMSQALFVIPPTTTIDEAMAIMTEKRFRHLPVMDEDELLGVISIGDLTKWVAKEQEAQIEHLRKYIEGDY